MKKFSSKSVLLFAAALAVCAFAPSMASAASWSVIGSHHTLDSPSLAYAIDANATQSTCAASFFTTRVTNAMDLEIIAASFSRCTSSGPAIGSCTTTLTATDLPWTATPTTTTLVDLRNIRIDQLWENHPGSTACGAAGVNSVITGGLRNADWNNTTRELFLANTTGLTLHSLLGVNPMTLNGTFRDTQQTLQILP